MILFKFFAHSPNFNLYKLKDTINDEVISELNNSSHQKEDYWDFITIAYKDEEKSDD